MENQNQETQKQQRKELTLRQKRNMMYFVEATEKILREEGIPGVTIRRIAAEAGYNSATLYNYFQDLDDPVRIGVLPPGLPAEPGQAPGTGDDCPGTVPDHLPLLQ